MPALPRAPRAASRAPGPGRERAPGHIRRALGRAPGRARFGCVALRRGGPPNGGRAHPLLSGGQHAAAHQRGGEAVGGRAGPVAQARRPQPHGLVQGPRHDRGRDAGAARPRPRGRVRVHRQHGGGARRLRRARRATGAGPRAEGSSGARQAGASARVRGPDAAGAGQLRRLPRARRPGERLGVYLLNSVNPFRLEGQKTIVLELLQQLGWESPDWIVVPAGNLGNTAAFGKALAEARAWGLIDRVPRLAAVQAEGAAPFAQSFRVEPHTVATAIKIGNPASYERAVRAIRDSKGVVTTVSDDEILEAKAVVDGAGIGCEPASAAAPAGARRLIQESVIGPRDRVVAVLTGHVLKDPEMVTRYHQELEPRPDRANRPIEIEARLTEVERVMGG